MDEEEEAEAEHVDMEEADSNLHIGISPADIRGERHQDHARQNEQRYPHDTGVDPADKVKLPIVDTPERSENKERNQKCNKLGSHFFNADDKLCLRLRF